MERVPGVCHSVERAEGIGGIDSRTRQNNQFIRRIWISLTYEQLKDLYKLLLQICISTKTTLTEEGE